MSAKGYLRTGEVADGAGVNVQTLRYYERIGLLAEPRRLPSGYRAYPPTAVATVRFIKRAQALGFTLTEVQRLLRRDGGCDEVRDLADDRIARLDRRIAELQAVRDELRRLAAACHAPHPEPGCPLADAIENAARSPRRRTRSHHRATAHRGTTRG